MTVDQLLRQALNAKRACRKHNEPAAICDQCYDLAEASYDAQWARERQAAHRRYLEAK